MSIDIPTVAEEMGEDIQKEAEEDEETPAPSPPPSNPHEEGRENDHRNQKNELTITDSDNESLPETFTHKVQKLTHALDVESDDSGTHSMNQTNM